MTYFSVSDTGKLGKRKSECSNQESNLSMEGDNGQKCTSIVLRGALYRTCCDVPGDGIYYPVCCYIAPDMSLYRNAHAITSYLMLLYRSR